jgi:tetratricopeptide (TPR) repeat protein
VFLARGDIEEALKLYTSVKDTYEGEALAMASLILAGQLAKSGETGSLAEAEEIYKGIAGTDYAGAVFAELNMASTEAALGAYETALARLKRFRKKHIIHKEYARSLNGHIMHNWIAELYKNKDYYKVIKVVSEHGSRVPFGKKAETYLRIGNSYAVLSLLPDAVKTLSIAREIGRPGVAEGAMISLGRVYLSQRDPGAVERLMENFSRRFPDTLYKGEVRGILAKAAYMKGDYKAYLVASSGDPDISRAKALKGLRRYSEALSVYERVVSGKGTGDVKRLTAAYIGAADCSFMLGRYNKAVAHYNSALEQMGEGGDEFRSWALYRITQSYSRLDDGGKVQEALDSISAVDDAFGRSAVSLFKGPARNF